VAQTIVAKSVKIITFIVSTLLLNFFTMMFVVAMVATTWDKGIVGVSALDEFFYCIPLSAFIVWRIMRKF